MVKLYHITPTLSKKREEPSDASTRLSSVHFVSSQVQKLSEKLPLIDLFRNQNAEILCNIVEIKTLFSKLGWCLA